jgi:hypothetical protein
MNRTPTPVEIAMVAAPIYAAMPCARASISDAVHAARLLIEEAEKPAAEPQGEPLICAERAAKQIGYVSRNWRNQLRSLCVKEWDRIAAGLPAVGLAKYGGFKDGEEFFAAYESRGWDARTVARVKSAKHAALTESRKRRKPSN